MKLLLDTHAFLWLVEGDHRLSRNAETAIADAGNDVYLSVAGIWELAIKSGDGKILLNRPLADYVAIWAPTYRVEVLPVISEHALEVESLPPHHRDPFDRMMVAQAMVEGMSLVSIDPAMSKYAVPIVW